jgi:type I restriction enzyme R subunit
MNGHDLDCAPFYGKGGIGKMFQLFGDERGPIIDEMNQALAA